jgi:hypothetical protein
MLLVTFLGIAPDWQTQLGMGGLSFVVSFFGVRGWLSRHQLGKLLWVIFMVVEVFSHTSFGLISTGMAADIAKVTAAEDPEMARLKKRSIDLDTTARELSGKVGISQKRITEANDLASAASLEVTNYRDSGHGKAKLAFDADNFFTAVPDAVTASKPSRWIALIFFMFIFTGMQITVVIAAEGVRDFTRKRTVQLIEEEEVLEEGKRTGRKPGVRREMPKKVILAWVNAYWADHSAGASDKLVIRSRARKIWEDAGIKITGNWDQKLFDAVQGLGLVSSEGRVQIPAIEARKKLDSAMQREGV